MEWGTLIKFSRFLVFYLFYKREKLPGLRRQNEKNRHLKKTIGPVKAWQSGKE